MQKKSIDECVLCGCKCKQKFYIELRKNSKFKPFCYECFERTRELKIPQINTLIRHSNKGYVLI